MLEKWNQHLCGKIHSSLPCWCTYTWHFLHSATADLQQAWPKPLMRLQRHSPRATWPTLATCSGRNQHALPNSHSKQKHLTTKLTHCSQILKKQMGKNSQTIHQTTNFTTLQLDDIPDTLASQIGMFKHCYALRVNRSLWFGDMMHLPSHCWVPVSVCSKWSPIKLSPVLWTAANPTHIHNCKLFNLL